MSITFVAGAGRIFGQSGVIRVLPRGTARVPDYGAQAAGLRRSHGWEANATIGAPFKDAETGSQMRHLVYIKKLGQPIEISLDDPHIGEYRRHLRAGDLWAADKETAIECGVAFDPDFGGEHTEDAKAEQRGLVAEICKLHGADVPAHLANPVKPEPPAPQAPAAVATTPKEAA